MRRPRSSFPASFPAGLPARLLAATAGLVVVYGSSLQAQSNCPPAPPAGQSGAIRVGVAPPPPLPEYDQPPIPAYGDVWTPGYWGWNAGVNDYYWNPGVWVAPPAIGLLWTPGYWGWGDGVYLFHAGYWGPTVGFYGGIAYGYGYWGHGYDGGYWRGRTFYYNREYNNLGGAHFNAVFDHRVAGDRLIGRVSYNGGPNGVRAAPTAAELTAGRERHLGATAAQLQHERSVASDDHYRAGINHGHPPAGMTHGGGASAHSAAPAVSSTHLEARHGQGQTVGGHAAPSSHAEHAADHRRSDQAAALSRQHASHPSATHPEARRPEPHGSPAYREPPRSPAYRPEAYRPEAYRPAPGPAARAVEGPRGAPPHQPPAREARPPGESRPGPIERPNGHP